MRILLTLFLFIIYAFSSNIIISDSDTSYKDFEVSFYQDKTKKLNIEQIQNIKEFQNITNRISLGKLEGNIWLHFSIKNTTNKIQKRVFYITDPYLHEVNLFIVDNKKIIATNSVGIAVLNEKGMVAKYSPELEISLDAKKKIDIYISSYSPFQHTFKIEVNTTKDLIDHKILKNSLLYLYFGAIGALLLYNLFIYFSIRDNSYILYICFVFFYGLAQYEHNLFPKDIFSSTDVVYMFGTAHVFWVAFHTLFSVKLLNIKEYYPKLGKYLLYTGYFLLVIGLFGLYDLRFAIQIVHLLMIALPFLLLFTAIKLHLKKNKLAIFYIIAQTLFLTSSLIFGLLFAGTLEYSNFTRYIHFVGSFSEIILFSFALAYKTRLILKENQKQKELVDEYSKLSFLGQTVINIYHQWKSPINNIYNSINHIETAKEFKDKNINKIIDENLNHIRSNTQYLKDISLNYLGHYKQIDEEEKKVNLYNEISSVVKLIKLEATKINLQTTIKCKDDISFTLKKNHFTNLLMILLENAICEFKIKSIKNPSIEIKVEKKENEIIIQVQDNAGGIDIKPIERIFEQNHSNSSSTGIGLFLLKEYLLPKLNASISVKNDNNGALFKIVISHLNKK